MYDFCLGHVCKVGVGERERYKRKKGKKMKNVM